MLGLAKFALSWVLVRTIWCSRGGDNAPEMSMPQPWDLGLSRMWQKDFETGRLSWITRVDSASLHEVFLAAENQTDGSGQTVPAVTDFEDGGRGPGAKPRNVAAARSWEGPSVYSRRGNESLPVPARHLTPQANNHPEGAGDGSSPRTSRKEGSRLSRTSDLQSCNNFCCLSH